MKLLMILLLITGCNTLSSINRDANSHAYIPGKYDCRMFAEAKYKALIANGYKDEDIKFVITDYKKEPHVVLNVNGMILDNNYSEPYPATKALQDGLTPESWIKYRNTPM